MKYINKIPFDEDLILIMTSFINTCEKIPAEAIEFFPHIEKYMKKTKGLMMDTFELLNSFIIYEGNLFETNPEILNSLLNMIKSSFTDYKDSDKSVYLGYNLLSILIQVILIHKFNKLLFIKIFFIF